MTDKFAAELGKFFYYLFNGEESLGRQHCVQRFHGVALAHYEAVSVRIVHLFRTNIHLFKIKFYQNVHDAHVAADVAALAFYYHVDDVFSEVIG
ncbi:hypothetical protein IMSAGC007_04629 [Lachnospiraceae bacterium]|nr:hypothetical protein IMSAGC007_04629 [Lachnospiraceae bacterium]